MKTELQSARFYLPQGRTNPRTTALFVDGTTLLLISLSLFSLWRALHHRRRAAARARDEARGEAPLRAGRTVLHGRVVDDGDSRPAVSVRLDEVGREWRAKGGWHHKWTETAREIEVRPFYLVRATGERVRVEPDQRVFLVDKLEATEPAKLSERAGTKLSGSRRSGSRHRAAELVAGEPVYVDGTLSRGPDPLEGGYRGEGLGWVLHPSRLGRMLVSTEPLEERHRSRARLYLGSILLFTLALFFLHGVAYRRFDRLRFCGRTLSGRVLDAKTWRVWSGGRNSCHCWVPRYRVTAELTDGSSRRVTDEVSRGVFDLVRRADHEIELPFIVAGADAQVGLRASDKLYKIAFGLEALLILLLFWGLKLWRARPWYEQRRVVERGHGRLTR